MLRECVWAAETRFGKVGEGRQTVNFCLARTLSSCQADPSIMNSFLRLFKLLLVSLIFNAAPLQAAEIWTNPQSGFWHVTNNWSGGLIPTSGSTVQITNAGTKTVTLNAETAAENRTVTRLTLSAPSGFTNTLRIADVSSISPCTILYTLNVGSGGSLEISNSMAVINGDLGGALNIFAGNAVLLNSTLDCSAVISRIGRTNTAPAIFTVSSGQFMTDTLLIGSAAGAQGILNLSNGLVSVSSLLSLGETAGSTGTVNIAGGEFLVTNSLAKVGNVGAGVINMSGGTAHFLSALHLADASTGTGTLSLLGGQLNVTNDITSIGRIGVGQMIVSNATANLTNISVGRHPGSWGTMTLLTNGLANMAGDLSIGRFSGATGSVLVAGGHILIPTQTIWVGREGSGQLTISNGTIQAKDVLIAANFTKSSKGTLLMAGGTFAISSDLAVGSAGISTGIVSVVGGQLFVTNAAASADLEIFEGSLTLTGGVITTDKLRVTNAAGQFVFKSGTVETKSTTVANGVPFMVGDGTNAATLNLVGGTHSFANGLVISSNATVTGCGTIVGSIVNNGTLSVCSSTIVSIQKNSTTTVSFTTMSGRIYTLQYKNSLSDASWTSLPGPTTGTGSVMSITDSTPQPPTRFYRVAFN